MQEWLKPRILFPEAVGRQHHPLTLLPTIGIHAHMPFDLLGPIQPSWFVLPDRFIFRDESD